MKKYEIQYPEQDEIENKKMETNEKINKKKSILITKHKPTIALK